jgi:uncharacterized protein (TIGR02118 family)
MIKVAVLYENKPGSSFDMDYYMSQHIPLVQRLLGPALQKVTVETGLSGGAPGSPAAYRVIANLYFESVEAFGAAFGPVAAEVQSDVANYSSLEPVVQVNDLKLA